MDKCNLCHILAYTIDLQELTQLTADYISQNKQYFLGNWTIFPSKTKLTLHLGKITQIVWFSQVVWHMMSCSTLGSKKLGHKIFFLILPLNRTILRKCFLLFLYPPPPPVQRHKKYKLSGRQNFTHKNFLDGVLKS